MKIITLNYKKYRCPTSWDEVTLKNQMKVSDDDKAITIPELKKFAILSGYSGIPIEELKKSKLSELQELFKAIEFINIPIHEKQINEFDFNNNHYYIGQNIVDMEFQDFISIENTLSEYSGNTYNALPIILAIMCKKKKDGILESIDDYDIMKRAKEFEELPLIIAHNLSLFFSQVIAIYNSNFQSFLNPEVQRLIMQKQIESVESTLKKLDGKGLLTRCVTGILRHCLKYIKRQQDKHYISIQ